MGIGWGELLVILVVALLVFGPKKLPDIAKGLGKGIRDLRRAMSGLEDDLSTPPPSAPKPPETTSRPSLPEGQSDTSSQASSTVIFPSSAPADNELNSCDQRLEDSSVSQSSLSDNEHPSS